MLDLGWFFQESKSWFSFSETLVKIPTPIYESLFIKVMLTQYWKKTQKQIFLW